MTGYRVAKRRLPELVARRVDIEAFLANDEGFEWINMGRVNPWEPAGYYVDDDCGDGQTRVGHGDWVVLDELGWLVDRFASEGRLLAEYEVLPRASGQEVQGVKSANPAPGEPGHFPYEKEATSVVYGPNVGGRSKDDEAIVRGLTGERDMLRERLLKLEAVVEEQRAVLAAIRTLLRGM